MKLLLAEDERELSRALAAIFDHNGYSVDAVYNGVDAFDYAMAESYDGIILDIMMPKKDGLSVLSELRAAGNTTPVLILTARSELDDRILGLDLGADDYLTKPFAMGELLARVRALTRRRGEGYVPDILRLGNLTLNRALFELSGPSGSFRLGNKEYQLIETLMTSSDRLISTEQLMQRIWGFDSEAEINVVWVYISYLRKKLAAVGADMQIRAVRGVGYRLEAVDD